MMYVGGCYKSVHTELSKLFNSRVKTFYRCPTEPSTSPLLGHIWIVLKFAKIIQVHISFSAREGISKGVELLNERGLAGLHSTSNVLVYLHTVSNPFNNKI